MVKKCYRCGRKLTKDDLEGIPKRAKKVLCEECTEDYRLDETVSRAEAAGDSYETEMWRLTRL